MQINWIVRIKNKNFWIAVIPAVFLFVQTVLAVFEIHMDLGGLQTKLLAVVDALFVLLSILGIINDPTTATLSDSDRALLYTKPKE